MSSPALPSSTASSSVGAVASGGGGFRVSFEAAQQPHWTSISYKKLRNSLRNFRNTSPAPPETAARTRLTKFALRLDRDVERVDLFALREVGRIAKDIADAGTAYREVFGLGGDEKIRKVVCGKGEDMELVRLRDDIHALHSRYCSISEDLLLLFKFLKWNTKALKKLLKQAVTTFGRPGMKYGTRRLSASHVQVADDVTNDSPADSVADSGNVLRTQDSLSVTRLDVIADAIASDAPAVSGDALDAIARRSVRSEALALAAARMHLRSVVNNNHSRAITGLVLSVARTMERLAMAEELLMETTSASSIEEDPELRDRGNKLLQRLLEKKRVLEGKLDASSLQETLAAQAGIILERDSEDGDDDDVARRAKVPQFNLVLNVASAFLYLVSMYAVLPTAGLYAKSLGGSEALSGVLIGGAPLAGIFSSIFFSHISSAGFKTPLVVASVICLVGNVLYSLAASFSSIHLAMIGRLVIGLGGARAINRRYISDYAPVHQLVQRSAEFVTASALGMSLGPAMAAVVNRVPHFELLGLVFDLRTNAAWSLVVLWAVFVIVIVHYFVEPERPEPLRDEDDRVAVDVENGESSALVPSGNNATVGSRRGDGYGATQILPVGNSVSVQSVNINRVVRSPLRDLLRNRPVMFCLFLYFAVKFLCELAVSSTAIMFPYLFGWGDGPVGLFVAGLGFLMFPANIVVSKVALEMEISQQLLYSLYFVLGGCALGLPIVGPPSLIQYVTACIILFVSTNVAEAVLMALLARSMPASLARGTWNSGLLTTESGLVGRFLGDTMSTLCASGQNGMEIFMWRAFVLCTLLATFCVRGVIFLEDAICVENSNEDGKDSDDGSLVSGRSGSDEDKDMQ